LYEDIKNGARLSRVYMAMVALSTIVAAIGLNDNSVAVIIGAMVIAPLSETTQRYLFGFWTVIDEILNIVLFLLIGLEVLVLRPDRAVMPIALLAIPIVHGSSAFKRSSAMSLV
jgi:uncharacterized membrane protein